jgi:hypothetical protein
MKKYYDILFPQLLMLLTPTALRQPLLTAFTVALARPLEAMSVELRSYMDTLDMQSNAQTCYLRKLLNDEFDYYERRITVRTASLDTDKYLMWRRSENKPIEVMSWSNLYWKSLLLSRNGQLGADTADIEIILPTQLADLTRSETARLRQIVNPNKLTSKKFIITYE